MKGLRLIATGGALPGRTVTNEELSRTVDTSDEWITTRTGIRTRHYCTEGENAATLAIAAAKQTQQAMSAGARPLRCSACFAVDALPKCLHTVLDETGLTLDNLDWVVCHQANSRIIDHCVKALHADGAKFYKNMDRHGNTSAASIPLALNELAESGRLHPGQTLACIGFGGGLTWGDPCFCRTLHRRRAAP